MATPAPAEPSISVVVPVYNEVDNVAPLLGELDAALGPLGRAYEIIFVDDASTDGSEAALRELAAANPAVRVLRHRVNCGQSAGQASGFRVARGAIVVTMDADRQNDPADLPALLAAMTDGVDCVTGVRRTRRDSWLRRVSSRVANGFRNRILGERVSDAGCTYRAIRRACLAEVPVFNGMHRFIPTILRLQGYVVREVPIGHRPRIAGVAKYGVHDRLWRGLRDCFAMRWYRRRVIPAERLAAEEPGVGA